MLGDGINAGPTINSEALDFSPGLTPDGRALVFSSRRTIVTSPHSPPWTFPELDEALTGPGNGNLDLFLVAASTLHARQEEQ
jgi:hypothetical protein